MLLERFNVKIELKFPKTLQFTSINFKRVVVRTLKVCVRNNTVFALSSTSILGIAVHLECV